MKGKGRSRPRHTQSVPAMSAAEEASNEPTITSSTSTTPVNGEEALGASSLLSPGSISRRRGGSADNSELLPPPRDFTASPVLGTGRNFGRSYSEVNLFSAASRGEVSSDAEAAATEDLSESRKAIVMALIKQIRPGSEVKSLTLPMFVCQPVSTLEAFGDRFLHLDTFLPLSGIEDPEKRFLAVVRFYLSAWHIRPRGVKKPFNPIIGEVFDCIIADGPAGEVGEVGDTDDVGAEADDEFTHYISEQLSHHPPITALVAYNVAHGFICHSVLCPGYAKFWGNSAESKLHGTSYVRLFGKGWEETYAFSFPSFNVRGILMGQLCIEITGKTTVRCVSGQNCGPLNFSADIEFKSKGMFRGKFNQLSGEIKQGKDVLWNVAGGWDDEIAITEKRKGKNPKPLLRVHDQPLATKLYPPVVNQSEMFSHRVWDPLLSCVREGKDNEAMNAKLELEARERAEAKARKEAKEEWVPRWWDKSGPAITDPEADSESASLNKWQFKELDSMIHRIRQRGLGAESKTE